MKLDFSAFHKKGYLVPKIRLPGFLKSILTLSIGCGLHTPDRVERPTGAGKPYPLMRGHEGVGAEKG